MRGEDKHAATTAELAIQGDERLTVEGTVSLAGLIFIDHSAEKLLMTTPAEVATPSSKRAKAGEKGASIWFIGDVGGGTDLGLQIL